MCGVAKPWGLSGIMPQIYCDAFYCELCWSSDEIIMVYLSFSLLFAFALVTSKLNKRNPMSSILSTQLYLSCLQYILNTDSPKFPPYTSAIIISASFIMGMSSYAPSSWYLVVLDVQSVYFVCIEDSNGMDVYRNANSIVFIINMSILWMVNRFVSGMDAL